MKAELSFGTNLILIKDKDPGYILVVQSESAVL